MKTVFFLLIGCFSISLSAQSELKHYQKSIELGQIVLPYESYNDSLFTIIFPDSIYSHGTITIKKAKLVGLKKVGVILIFEDNLYTVSSMSVKGQKNFQKLKTHVFSKLGVEIIEVQPGDYCFDVNGEIIKLRYQELGRKRVLTLIKSECNP